MDSITQATLGAAVGEALLGKKVGYRAAVWGAVLGTIPDLDVLINPFVDSVNELYFHRNITHSIFFAVAASPVFGWLINKFHPQFEIGWKRWANLSFWVLFTHILIDLPTTYGTQILQPFSNHPYTTDSIFIIDPLFTLPMLIGLIFALVLQRSSNAGSYLNQAGLAIAALYMLWGLGIKSHVHSVFQESFKNQYGYFEKIKTTPNGPTTFLWSGYIVKQDTIYQSVYSIFDESTDLEFTAIPRNSHLIEPYSGDSASEALMWFSRGYYSAEETEEGEIIFYDLRFGRDDLWLTENGDYVWKNVLVLDENENAYTFEQHLPSFDARTRTLALFWDRIWGK
ncbi:metal-dependent hydrolase [soil metagenome]